MIEAVIVLAITAVLGAMTLPAFSSVVARERLQAAAQHLQADIALARQEAGRRGQPVHMMFQPGSNWCYALSAGIGVDCRRLTATAGDGIIKVVHAADRPGVLLQEADAMALDGRTGASLLGEGHARFASPEGQQLQVRLGHLGRATICAPAAAVPGTPTCPSTPTLR